MLHFRDLFLLQLNHLHLSNHQLILTILGCPNPLVKHYPHGITWIPAWMSNDNVYPFPNVHGYTVSNFHPTLCNGCNYLSMLWIKLGAINRYYKINSYRALQWRQNERDSVSNHQPHNCVLNRLFGCRSKKTSKLRVTGLCAGNSPLIGEFPAQMASNAENVSIWWRHHESGYHGAGRPP